MNVAIFNRELGVYLLHVYLLHEVKDYDGKSIKMVFNPYKDIIVIPVPSELIMDEEKLNLLKKRWEEVT